VRIGLTNSLSRIQLWQKMLLALAAFTVPTGVLGYYFTAKIADDIRFAQKEWCGDRYNRELRRILEKSEQLSGARHAGDRPAMRAVAEVDQSFCRSRFTGR